MKIVHVVGARPNFMKVAPVMEEIAKYPNNFKQLLVHTGQHYDANMSQVFLDELELPMPDVNLNVGSGSHAWQTAQIMTRFEPVLIEYKPDWLFVYGDVNSTIACALVAAKLNIKIAHVEAGLRSFDRTMPEEINRLLTDQIANLLFTPSQDANENLQREGILPGKICFVGNVMIDTLVRLLPKAKKKWPLLREQYNLDQYILVTLHRPSNVDEQETLVEIVEALIEISNQIPVLFPVHPRTREKISKLNIGNNNKRLIFTSPMGYLDFLSIQTNAAMVLTDSGGIQEETTYLGIPCLTVRPNTERPVTITHGTNHLVESRKKSIISAFQDIMNVTKRLGSLPELWDGMTAKRIVQLFKI